MEYFFDCLPEIKEKMRKAKKQLLALDFDGTLAKIAAAPEKAHLENSTKDLLKKLNKFFYIAIISGRSLSDIKSKVGLSSLIYSGNHGLEWQIGKKRKAIKINSKTRKKILLIKKAFENLYSTYPKIIIEDKSFGLSIHYRLLDKKLISEFLKESKKITSSFKKDNHLRVIRGKKVIEIHPDINWNKGLFLKFLLKYLEMKNHCSFFVFYVGDDKTDEDAFGALPEGITVRMGGKQQSSARYFIKTNEINKLLSCLSAIALEQNLR